MSENPQHAPVPPAVTRAPGPGGPAWPTGGYVQSVPGAPPVYLPPSVTPPAPTTSKALGTIAVIVAICAVAFSSVLSATTSFAAASGAVAHAGLTSTRPLEHLSDDQTLALLSPVRGLVLWAEIGFWSGTVLGVWALIQGIVAIASRRGRGQGIGAVIVAAAGPIVYAVAVTLAVLAGVVAAIPTYS
ncbi:MULTISPECIES: hypothetical protein [unclassified Microbacterium]|uniref:hypothetical protein n=1 Tax=unclassified Microbacterium TaxID=2609290 RepID=UPI000DD14320|nr:hypothetical protein [Microbacterium sp. PM5]AXA95401.1 hypothetical protein CEP17_02615 [Microbacterium sp. PM5]MDC7804962.1 hypothetical protein [Sphingomonas sp. BLCC-B65]